MFKKVAAVSVFLMVQAGNGALAADGYGQGVAAYNAQNFQQAVASLEGVVAHAKAGDPLAHYYLACSLMRLHRFQAATKEFETAAKLQPNQQLSEYINSALACCRKQCGPYTGSVTRSTLSAQVAPVAAASAPITVKSFGSSSDVSSWSAADQAAFYEKSKQNLLEAEQQLRGMQTLARSGSSVTSNARAYGETEEDLRVRTAAADAAAQPARDAVRRAEREVEEAREIAATCADARSKFDGAYNSLLTKSMLNRMARGY